MKTKLETRLKILMEEYQKGQEQLVVMNREATNLENTMLRISGAIQVLEELLANKESENHILLKDGLKLAKNLEK